jgi:hypothetical protein
VPRFQSTGVAPRFPQIVEALARLRSRSCIIDGEAVEHLKRIARDRISEFESCHPSHMVVSSRAGPQSRMKCWGSASGHLRSILDRCVGAKANDPQ